MRKDDYHEPVLVHEVIDALAPLNKLKIIDATVGTAGHTFALVEKGANVLGIEADRTMHDVAKRRLEKSFGYAQDQGPALLPRKDFGGRYKLVLGNYRDIDKIANENGFTDVDGALFDLGVSNLQLISGERGFSFLNPKAELDMRVSLEEQALKAKDLLNALRNNQLVSLFGHVLTIRDSRYLAAKVIAQREIKPFETVADFLEVATRLPTKKRLHPATLPFLALRMAVNSELENLEEALPKATKLLKRGGKLLIINFHSAERNVIFDFMNKAEKQGLGRVVTEYPIVPTEDELKENPRARSSELRIISKA